MIKLFAEIELLTGGNQKFLNATCTVSGLENSATVQEVLGKSVNALNPFIIGEDFDNRTLEQKLEYFHGSIYSDDMGEFKTPYIVSFSTSEPIDTFFVSFDTYNKLYPKYINLWADLNGVFQDVGTFTDDDVQWEFKLPGKCEKFTMYIYNWIAPNKPFVLTGIYADLTIHLDYNRITDISTGVVTQANFDKPSYGIVSNSGTISFNDFYNEISDYIELGLLKEGALVNIWIENSLIPSQKYKVSEMYTDKWTYDEENKSVTVSLVDGLEKLQEISFEGIAYYPRTSETMNYGAIYRILKRRTEDIGMVVKISEDVMSYIAYMANFHPYMNSCSVWEAWRQFAEATKTHIYKNANGELSIHF